MSDLLGALLLPSLSAQVRGRAPGVALDILHLSPPQTVDALDKDEVDLAVSMGLEHSATIRSEALLEDRMVCVMASTHPLAHEELTLPAFLAQRHLKVSMSPTDLRFVDDVLATMALRRDIALNVPHWLVVPEVLAGSDLVAVMPSRLAMSMAHPALTARALPFASDPFNWTLYWHRRQDANAGNRWLRDQIRETARKIRAS